MKFAYTIVYVPSVPETLAFYKKAFGFETRFLHESKDYGELETGETTLAFASHALGEMNLNGQYHKVDPNNIPLGIEIAFTTNEVSSAYDKAIEAGAAPIQPPAEKPWGQVVAYVRAKDGTLIELCSPMS